MKNEEIKAKEMRETQARALSDDELDGVAGGVYDGGAGSGLVCPKCLNGDVEENIIYSPFFQMMYRTITRYTGRCRNCGYRWNYYTLAE